MFDIYPPIADHPDRIYEEARVRISNALAQFRSGAITVEQFDHEFDAWQLACREHMRGVCEE